MQTATEYTHCKLEEDLTAYGQANSHLVLWNQDLQTTESTSSIELGKDSKSYELTLTSNAHSPMTNGQRPSTECKREASHVACSLPTKRGKLNFI